MLSGLAAALSRSEVPSECIRNVGKNAYTASPTTAIPTKLPGIKLICTVMHFSGHIRNTLYLQESSWAVSWASHYLCSFQPTSLLAPPCSFLQKLLPNCVPPPQHMLFCSLMRLSQLLHSCLPPTGRAEPVAWTLRSQQSTWEGLMEMTRFSGQCLWHHKRWTQKVPRPFPQHCPWPVCQWVREDYSLLFSCLRENFLIAVQVVGIVSLPVCFYPLQPITQNLSKAAVQWTTTILLNTKGSFCKNFS